MAFSGAKLGSFISWHQEAGPAAAMSAIPAYKASLAAGADGTRPGRAGAAAAGPTAGLCAAGRRPRTRRAGLRSPARGRPGSVGTPGEAVAGKSMRGPLHRGGPSGRLGQMHLTTPGSSYQLISCGFARPDAGWKRPAGGGPAPSAAEGGVTVRAHSPGERPARPPAGGPSRFGRAHSGAAIRRGREEPAT